MYHPEPKALLFAIQAWLEQAQWLICVDNGHCDDALRNGMKAIAPERVHYVSAGRNLGIGAAINHGIEVARKEGCSHVVLGDQDSIAQPEMINELLRVEKAASAQGLNISAVGPRRVDMDSGRHSYFVRCGAVGFKRVRCKPPDNWVVADFLISSGSLIRMTVIDEVGRMDEGFFIDMVDTDWFLRANQSGRVAIGACDAWMTHQLGERTQVIHFLRRRTVPFHQSIRYYYMIRNRLVLYRRLHAPLWWIISDLIQLAKIAFFFGIFPSDRLQNTRMMLQGFADGLRGVSGEHPTPPRA
ncbi:MAG: glycosyltransferase family 2 protein [Burkholderiales bacterium]